MEGSRSCQYVLMWAAAVSNMYSLHTRWYKHTHVYAQGWARVSFIWFTYQCAPSLFVCLSILAYRTYASMCACIHVCISQKADHGGANAMNKRWPTAPGAHTETVSPAFKRILPYLSFAFLPSISETWIRPWTGAPMSTNTPYSVIDLRKYQSHYVSHPIYCHIICVILCLSRTIWAILCIGHTI